MSIILKLISGKLRLRQLFKSDIEDFAHSHMIDDLPTHITNVQPDWNQTVNTEDDFIKNKPTITGKIWKYKISDNWWFDGSISVLPFDGDVTWSIRDFSNTTYLNVPGAAGIFKIPETGYYTINSAMLISPSAQNTFSTQNMTMLWLKVFKNGTEIGKLHLFRTSYKDSAGTGPAQWNTSPYLAGVDTFSFAADDLVSVRVEGSGTFNDQIRFLDARLVIHKKVL